MEDSTQKPTVPKHELMLLIELKEKHFFTTSTVQQLAKYGYNRAWHMIERWKLADLVGDAPSSVPHRLIPMVNNINQAAFKAGIYIREIHVHCSIKSLLEMPLNKLSLLLDDGVDVLSARNHFQSLFDVDTGIKYVVCDSSCDSRDNEGKCLGHYYLKGEE